MKLNWSVLWGITFGIISIVGIAKFYLEYSEGQSSPWTDGMIALKDYKGGDYTQLDYEEVHAIDAEQKKLTARKGDFLGKDKETVYTVIQDFDSSFQVTEDPNGFWNYIGSVALMIGLGILSLFLLLKNFFFGPKE